MKHLISIKWSMSPLTSALLIEESAVLRFLRDGRNAAFLLKFRLSNELNWDLVEGHNAPTHLVSTAGDLWVIKTCTKISGMSLCSNSMIGKGRKFNVTKFLDEIKLYKGFLACDLDNFPNVDIYEILSSEVSELYKDGFIRDGRMSYKFFTELLKKTPHEAA